MQRERILAAATELLGARGFGGFTATDIARRAGVSLAAFYACFGNRDECVLAGYDRFIEVLVGRLTDVVARRGDDPGIVQIVMQSYLATLQDDLVVARAYQVEIDGLGAPARARRRDSLNALAALLRELAGRLPRSTDPDRLPPLSAWVGIVYAVRQLASDVLESHGPDPDLVSLVAMHEDWISTALGLPVEAPQEVSRD